MNENIITENKIIDVIKKTSEIYSVKGINFDNILVSTLYNCLVSIFIKNKKYIFLQAPTGSGKSIIGLMLNACIYELTNETSYYLTSTKLLQNQLENDLKYFNIDNVFMLKGSSNYNCKFIINKNKKLLESGMIDETQYNELMKNSTFKNRECLGIPKNQIPSNELFVDCFSECPYKIAREQGANSQCTILNYNYFLSMLSIKNNGFFDKRFLTICDETHKLSDILNSNYTIILSRYFLNKITEYLENYKNYIKSDIISEKNLIKSFITKCNNLYFEKFVDFSHVFENEENKVTFLNFLLLYQKIISTSIELFNNILYFANSYNDTHARKNLGNFDIDLKNENKKLTYPIEILNQRSKDIYIQTIAVSNNIFKYEIKDINETILYEHNFLKYVDVCIFMSATLGNMDNLVNIMGLSPELCELLTIPSFFDYSKSPIYLIEAGYLSAKTIISNIDNVLNYVLNICLKFHSSDKGIIHTHTNLITNKFKTMVNVLNPTISKRFLFYTNSQEKENNVEIMKKDPDFPYIIVGPSLVEGLDLKNDLGRFNILIKVPYPPIDEYMKRKMVNYPYYYHDCTIKSIVQSVGRTNRNKTDSSIVYLMDTKFKDIIFDCDPDITNRITKLSPDLKNQIKPL